MGLHVNLCLLLDTDLFNLLPHILYLQHCIFSINNSNFQIFSKNNFYISIISFENIMDNGTYAPQEQMFHFS